jgi:hypothetical protein
LIGHITQKPRLTTRLLCYMSSSFLANVSLGLEYLMAT